MRRIEYYYHYFQKAGGPFLNLSTLDPAEARAVLDGIRRGNKTFAARRDERYLERRRELEGIARELFVAKGGRPATSAPHYLVVERCDWLETWYEEPECLRIPIRDLDTAILSFSYGDLFPTFSPSVDDGKEYRRKIYTFEEMMALIEKYGLPQDWNGDGRYGPERYVEVHLWGAAPSRYARSASQGGADQGLSR